MSAGRPDVQPADLGQAEDARRHGGRSVDASASGTPSAWRFWTASIIVSTLPASTPSGPRTVPLVHLHVEAAEASTRRRSRRRRRSSR